MKTARHNVLYSWSSACAVVREEIRRGSLRHLTVDVFDTLLFRVTPPEAVIRGTCKFLSRMTGIEAGHIEAARSDAWSIESGKSQRAGNDPDARSGELFLTWLNLLGVDDAERLSAETLAFELSSEMSCLASNPEMLQLLIDAKKAGVRVSALSDMYLSADEVRRLLDCHGFGGLIGDVFTSSDLGYQKKTGRMFDWFVSMEGTTEGVLHIGDDMKADGSMPSSREIRSIAVFDRRRMSIRHRLQAMTQWSSRIAAAAAGQSYDAPSRHHSTGFETFGPIYTPFVHSVAARAVADGVSSVWFLAREGWLLHEIYGLVRQSGLVDGAVPPSGYLYASRVATMRAQLETFGEKEVGSVQSDTWSRSYKSTLSPLQLSSDGLSGILSAVGLAPDEVVSEEGLASLRSHAPFAMAVREVGEAERLGLRKYLERIGFPMRGRVAIVDVGWGGQIQENLIAALRKMDIETEVVGYYLGTDERAQDRRSKNGMEITGLLTDKMSTDGHGLGAFSAVQAIELATRAGHGSVRGYMIDGTPRLVPEDEMGRIAEIDDDPPISAIQQGVLAFAERYIKVSCGIGVGVEDSLALARDVVDRFALMPTKQEAVIITDMKNIANLGMDETIRLGSAVSIRRPRELVRVLRTTLWQEGTMALAMPFFGPATLLGYRRLKHMVPPIRETGLKMVPQSSIGVVHDLITPDILDHDLTDTRNRLAHEVNGPAVVRSCPALTSIRHLAALAIVRTMHRANPRDAVRLIVAEVQGMVAYLVQAGRTLG